MNADEPIAKRNDAPDRTIPEDGAPQPQSGADIEAGIEAGIEAEIDAEIAAWKVRLDEVAALKAKARPIEETGAALDDLHRLRALGMEAAERNERQAKGLLTLAERDEAVRGDCGLRFTRIAKAVRQIVVLEQELMGLRAAPEPAASRPSPSASRHPLPRAGEGKERERSDLDDLHDPDDLHDYDDYDDYDRRPIEQVLAAVRQVLNVPEPTAMPRRRAVAPRGDFSGDMAPDDAGDRPPPTRAAVRERGPP